MKIAMFTDTFLPQLNGVVRSVVITVNELVRRGHTVEVYTMDLSKLGGCPGDFSQLRSEVRVHTFFSLAAPRFPDVQCRVPTYFPTLRCVRSRRPDLIHCHTNFTIAWEARWISRALDIPLVSSHHGLLAEYLRNFGLGWSLPKEWMRHHLASSYNSSAAVIAPSTVLIDELRRYGCTSPIYKVSNPLDDNMFAPRKLKHPEPASKTSTRPRIVHVGRLVPQKSVDVLLRAFDILLRTGVDAELAIVGDGREREKLQRLSLELGIDNRVAWLGVLQGDALVHALATSDIFASASATETQGIVFLEAMAVGLPCVGVHAGGVPEYVRHGVEGLIASPHHAGDFAAALSTLVQDPPLRQNLGAAAQRSAGAYKASGVVDELETLYKAAKR